MPRDFEFPLVPGQLNRSELWVPMSFAQGELENGTVNYSLQMLARLKPGIAPAEAQDDAEIGAQRSCAACRPHCRAYVFTPTSHSPTQVFIVSCYSLCHDP